MFLIAEIYIFGEKLFSALLLIPTSRRFYWGYQGSWTLISSSVTRWLYYFTLLGHLQHRKAAPNQNSFTKNWINPQPFEKRFINFCLSGEISPNLVTLVPSNIMQVLIMQSFKYERKYPCHTAQFCSTLLPWSQTLTHKNAQIMILKYVDQKQKRLQIIRQKHLAR